MTQQKPLSDTLRSASASIADDAHAIRAGITNTFFLRAEQLGRRFLTPVDARKIEIIMGVMMAEPTEGEMVGVQRIAPQAQPAAMPASLVSAVEAALASAEN